MDNTHLCQWKNIVPTPQCLQIQTRYRPLIVYSECYTRTWYTQHQDLGDITPTNKTTCSRVSPTPHISTIHCTPSRVQNTLTNPRHTILIHLVSPTDTRCTKNLHTATRPPPPIDNSRAQEEQPHPGYHIAHSPQSYNTQFIPHMLRLMMRSQHPPHTNNNL
jgi:hypothetical protein